MSETTTDNSRRRRIAIVGRSRDVLETYCGSLAGFALAHGREVLCCAPGFPSGKASEGVLAGTMLSGVAADSDDPRSFAGAETRKALAQTLDDWRPDIVLACGTAPLASLPAGRRNEGMARACLLIPEDDHAPRTETWLRRWPLMRRLSGCNLVLVSDHALAEALMASRLGQEGTRVVVTPGRGCATGTIPPVDLPTLADGLRIVLLDDGCDEAFLASFTTAAEKLSPRSAASRFIVAREALYATAGHDAADGEGPVSTQTYQPGNEAAVIREAHVIVQGRAAAPYPFAFLTALATGRPVIARDTPAMREAVDEVVNGILVDGDQPAALTKAIEMVLRRPDLLVSMARASRAKAERKFDSAIVNAVILAAIDA